MFAFSESGSISITALWWGIYPPLAVKVLSNRVYRLYLPIYVAPFGG
ncbi:hypothetical protein CBM2599_B50295 [Cupriavidus taiwanensis]|nr:hypothetical protein CBM2600_B10693 [Cupriavidus taiwanensis]SOY96363.1 hypothetical protein CBM2599_B50295 [Cupriavidus taiwanensis]